MENNKDNLSFIQLILTEFKLIWQEKWNIFLLAFPFVMMDTFMRILASDVNYSNSRIVFPGILFSLIWIGIIVAISRSLKGTIGQMFYATMFGWFFAVFFTNYVYYPYTGFFFSFNLLQSASEGKAYIFDTLKSIDFIRFIICSLAFSGGATVINYFPKVNNNHPRRIIVILSIFIILHSLAPSFLGAPNSSLQWDTWRNPRNVYDTFNDSNKNMKICGLYEYAFRDAQTTFFKPAQKDNPEETKFLDNIYAEDTPRSENNYTGIFEGKNVIFLQLEGLDNWLLNETDTPVMYGMLKNSINFTQHYSYYTGGGSTFNSELAVNTGFITPISYTKNAYSFNRNYFPNSLPNVLKRKGYSVNAFHMNNGEYYMRNINYANWGYDNYYGLMDQKFYPDASYQLDRELILNEDFYDKIFKQKPPFMHYIITYTPHTPFSIDSKVGKLIAKKKVEEGVTLSNLTEEDVARLYAAETDYMVELLLKGLEDNGLIDDTIIVAFADHYLYTLNDKTILDQYKTTEDNRINRTPFFIWSKGFNGVEATKVNSQLDILPTVLNMLGENFYKEDYIGTDVMDEFYSGYVFFSDYSWYDGANYVQYSDKVSDNVIHKAYIDTINDQINNRIKQNDLTLKYDYLRRLEEE